MRRRLHLDHRRHAAEHRRPDARRDSRHSQSPAAQSRARVSRTATSSCSLLSTLRTASSTPFVLVVEGSIPNEKNKTEGYWAAFGTDQTTGQPIPTCDWIDRLAPQAWAVVAAGTCAAYGGIHAMAGNPTGCMGLADYLGWDWKSKAGMPMVCVPGLSGAAGQLHGNRCFIC